MPQPPFLESVVPSIVELQSVDSTNNYARRLVDERLASHGMAVFAHEQTQGRGQMGKKWIAESGSNILLSVLLNPYPLELSQQFHISAAVAVSIHRFFSKFAGTDTRIKWPNDLYWQDRKAGGVLIENVIGAVETNLISDKKKEFTTNSRESGVSSQSPMDSNSPTGFENNSQTSSVWKWAIVGIGININQTVFSPELKNPVSLKQITGKYFEPVELAKQLSMEIINGFDLLVKEGFEPVYSSYIQHLYKKGELVKLKKDNVIFEARIKSVSPIGKLVVENAFEEEFDFGKIEWVH